MGILGACIHNKYNNILIVIIADWFLMYHRYCNKLAHIK